MIREHRHASRLKQWRCHLIILTERTLPWPRLVPYAAAVVLLYGALIAVAPELSAAFGVFGGLTEDEGSGVGLMLGITAVFIACLCGETEDHF